MLMKINSLKAARPSKQPPQRNSAAVMKGWEG